MERGSWDLPNMGSKEFSAGGRLDDIMMGTVIFDESMLPDKVPAVVEEPSVCPDCGAELVLGSYPFCRGKKEDHETVRSRWAQEGSATVVYRSRTGECWYPVGDNARPPIGYEKVELHNTQERDSFEREIGERETAKFRESAHNQRTDWNKTMAMYRDKIKELKEMSPTGRMMADQISKDMEKREKMYDQKLKGEAGFHIVGNHYYGKGPIEEG